MPKIKLIREVTFPDGVKAKGEIVEVSESTADWLIQVGAAEKVTKSQEKRIKSQKTDSG